MNANELRRAFIDFFTERDHQLIPSASLIPHDDTLLMQLPRDTAPLMLKRLPMFILMSKVSVSDASDRLVAIGVAGEAAEQQLSGLFSALPAQRGERTQERGITLLRMPDAIPRFTLVGSAEAMIEAWTRLADGATAADSSGWEWLRLSLETLNWLFWMNPPRDWIRKVLKR